MTSCESKLTSICVHNIFKSLEKLLPFSLDFLSHYWRNTRMPGRLLPYSSQFPIMRGKNNSVFPPKVIPTDIAINV